MLAFRLRLFGVAFSLLLGGIREAPAQTECEAVLKPVLVTTVIKSSTHDQASFSFACSHDFEEFNDTYGGSASGQYFAIGGSGAYNQGNYKKFQHDKCNQAKASEHQSNFQYNTLRDASPGAVAAWQACMANLAGFNCWAEPENKDIAIVLSLKEPGMFQIQDATLSEGAVLRTPKNKISPNSALKFGTTRVVVSRPNTDIPISLTVNIAGDFKVYSCTAVVPAVMPLPPPPPPHKCGKKEGQFNFYGDGCGDGYNVSGHVVIVNFGHGGSTVIPKNNPAYHADVGYWKEGDFNGDGLTDLIHFVVKVPGVDPYVHVHFSKGKGEFAPPTDGFKFSEHGNPDPRQRYDANLGEWRIQYDPETGRDSLVHDPKLDGRIHVWRSKGDGTFTLGSP